MPMRRLVNPVPAVTLTPAERRAELCSLLAAGLLRLRQRDSDLKETICNSRDIPTTHPRRTERYCKKRTGVTHDAA